jgi:hypothetical protein
MTARMASDGELAVGATVAKSMTMLPCVSL